ncbi:MAG: hypothetical protein U0P45_03575 [Acidimicrobiales bacterium]
MTFPIVDGGTADPPKYSVPLHDDTGRTYLDLSSDGSGYLYVLSYGDPADPSSYRVDCYLPNGKWIYATEGTNAGKVAVDYWRNVYSLDYQPLPGQGQAPISWFPVAEPTVTQWTTKTPK